MNVLIIEDERPAAQKLSRLLKEIQPGIRIIGILESVEQSINWFLTNPAPDLIFMDIQLEDGISFEIFENCRIDTPIIFTTAYDTFTLKAFKVNSVDYLLKPIVPEDLQKAIEKFKTLHIPVPEYVRLEQLLRQFRPARKERFLIRVGEHYTSIPVATIHCFYIRERCTFLVTQTGKHYPVDYSLDQIEQLIDPVSYFRINRNFIIRFEAIGDLLVYSSNRLKIILSDGMIRKNS